MNADKAKITDIFNNATAKFSKTDLRSLIVPLPPLKEINRIVDTINKTLEILA